MMRRVLTLRRTEDRQTASAWLIAGADIGTWLGELAQWSVAEELVRLYVLPASLQDHTPAGLLVVVPAGENCTPTRRALPYARVGIKLLIPADSRLHPPVAPDELAALLVWDLQIFHPTIGLVGFGPDDSLRITDLLAAPAQEDADWDRAVPGIPEPAALREVIAIVPTSVEQMLQQGGDDIGSESMAELPRAPQESGLNQIMAAAALAPFLAAAGLGALAQQLQQMIHRAKRAAGLNSAAPGRGARLAPPASMLDKIKQWLNAKAKTPGGRGPIPPAMEEWLRKMYATMAAALEPQRNRELQRLMEMLRHDPDQGLRHAISLGGMEGSRGVAPPSAQLTTHQTVFNARWLSGGGPANAWNVPNEMRANLLQRYRELANRELNLGRHRRAAYIFAHLLGDFYNAANALRQSRHFREAAMLYREKLNQPMGAADCLAEGGLLTEAAQLYEELQAFEKAGDLYTRLENFEQTERLYRAAVRQKLDIPDILAAAKLLETKLQVPDEALALLDTNWPDGLASVTCLKESFVLRGRLGRHEESLQRVVQLRRDPASSQRILPLAEVLSGMASNYPDTNVRAQAADVTRVLAGERLVQGHPGELDSLVNVVVGLDRADRLLRRDGNRFVTQRRPKPASLPALALRPRADKPRTIKPELVHQFELARDVTWSTAVWAGEKFYAAGRRRDAIIFMGGRWTGKLESATFAGEHSTAPIILEPSTPSRPASRLLAVNMATHRCMQINDMHSASTPRLPAEIYGLACDDGCTFVVHRLPDKSWVLSTVDSSTGETRSTCDLSIPDLGTTPTNPIPIVASRNHIFVAYRHQMMCRSYNTWKDVVSVRLINSLVASDPRTRLRVAVVYDEGGMIIWPGEHEQPFAEGMTDPMVTFTRRGTLVALNGTEGRLYRTDEKSVQYIATFAHQTDILALMPTSHLDEFAVLSRDGTIRIFVVPV